ncbi:MAG: hypothetical protein M1834_002044 [Cirrosporium novae-zelandiae]|nr:MAG: hypothetical protein M1834_002044 [Cirrosporium novae-zelandiae]
MSRQPVGIDRLPARRMSEGARESMNCKSCRKRKIKCNRLRPTCEACNVFQCPCIYDAVPKKRGPKTDVLEALLKRVDGLEKRLKEEKKDKAAAETNSSAVKAEDQAPSRPTPTNPSIDISNINSTNAPPVFSPTAQSPPSPGIYPDVLLDTFFLRVHGKPFHILDETTIRQKHQLNQVPSCLLLSIYALSARYATHPGGYNAAVRSSQDYATRARKEIDTDEPTIENLQSLLLLSMAFHALGKGKKSYLLLSNAIGMAMALDLHREHTPKARVTALEREIRRRLFWTCYIMDRFAACGSKRPSLIADKCVILRLPSWAPHLKSVPVEGDYFSNTTNLQFAACSRKGQEGIGMLIDIVRILGITNRYLAAGGVKGDSHFPWHSLSNLSKIRQELDIWASGTQEMFTSVETLFGQPDSTTLVLSKLVYHLIHCLIYRPFLPIDLAELRGTGQHQSWQIEATNLCFMHANAIAELVELGKGSAAIEWPAFVGYCICTAGTVHVHGAHYKGLEGEVYSSSADFLSREMHQLSELRFIWAGVQHQRETLQAIYTCHSELVKTLGQNQMRFSPVFHLEDFFDRYPGRFFDGANVSFADVDVQAIHEKPIQLMHNFVFSGLPGRDVDRINMFGAPSWPSDNMVPPNQQALPPMHHIPKHIPQKRPLNHRRATTDATPRPERNSFKPDNIPPRSTPQQPLPNFEPPTHTNSNDSQQQQNQSISQGPFSPSLFDFSPLASQSFDPNSQFDPMFGMAGVPGSFTFDAPALTPGGQSQSGSTQGDQNGGSGGNGQGEKDPFLTLLEQLAEKENEKGMNGGGGTLGGGDLDFFMGGSQSFE